jgi:peptidoglycan/xylan/chitin deacetylase (PgdA/CDA1 family)
MIARHPLVEIGNHTHSHAILTVIDPEEQYEEIRRCQLELERITGRSPQAIAYPNGNFSAETVVSATRAGIYAGVTCLPSRTPLGKIGDPETRMTIGRFASLRHARMERELALATAHTGLAMRLARDERVRLLSASATNRH